MLPPSDPTSSASTMPDVPSRVLGVCHELCYSEAAYVADLRSLLREREALLRFVPAADVRAIFSNAAELLGVNDALLRALPFHNELRGSCSSRTSPSGRRSCTSSGSLENISDEAAAIGHVARAFVSVAPFFKLYSTYCQDYEAALQRLETLSRQPAFARYREEGGQDAAALESMLIKPIQRLCKYPLFFRTLTEAAPTDELTKASALIDALAQTVNSTVKAAKARSRMATLLQRLGSDGEESFLSLLAPHRELLLEARVRFCEVALRADGGVSKKRRSSQPVGASASGKLLLFSDCLLLAHKPAAGPAAWAMAHFDAAPRSGELNSGELSTVSASTPVSGPRNRLVARALVPLRTLRIAALPPTADGTAPARRPPLLTADSSVEFSVTAIGRMRAVSAPPAPTRAQSSGLAMLSTVAEPSLTVASSEELVDANEVAGGSTKERTDSAEADEDLDRALLRASAKLDRARCFVLQALSPYAEAAADAAPAVGLSGGLGVPGEALVTAEAAGSRLLVVEVGAILELGMPTATPLGGDPLAVAATVGAARDAYVKVVRDLHARQRSRGDSIREEADDLTELQRFLHHESPAPRGSVAAGGDGGGATPRTPASARARARSSSVTAAPPAAAEPAPSLLGRLFGRRRSSAAAKSAPPPETPSRLAPVTPPAMAQTDSSLAEKLRKMQAESPARDSPPPAAAVGAAPLGPPVPGGPTLADKLRRLQAEARVNYA